MSNSIKVYARIKPTKRPSGYFELEKPEGIMRFEIPVDKSRDLVNNTRSSYTFKFDGILDQSVSQDTVFDKVARDAALNAIEGYNATIFAYGQTGSGKTFTITGGVDKYADRGIVPRTLSMLFDEFATRADTQFTAYISFLEIYNESGYDLLDPSQETAKLEDLPKVSLMEDEDGNVHLKNLSMHKVTNEEEALNLLFLGDTNRAISETPMNPSSSRSHCIFTISIEAQAAGSDTIRRSKLHLVDLAGSERVHKTSAGGQLLREAKYINTSLHYLEMVIVALQEKRRGRTHIPYRNSMMTSVLRDSLGGNCKTSMVATLNAEDAQTDETITTCRFAQRVARIQNNALVNEEVDPKLLIRRLKGEVRALKQEVAYLKGEKTDEEAADAEMLEEMQRAAKAFVASPLDNPRLELPEMSITRVHEMFAALRTVAREGGFGGGSGEMKAGDGGHTGGPGAFRSESEVEEDNRRLRQQLQQRDNEIKILVKMVHKQQGAGAGAPPPRGAIGAVRAPSISTDGPVDDVPPSRDGRNSSWANAPPSVAPPQQQSAGVPVVTGTGRRAQTLLREEAKALEATSGELPPAAVVDDKEAAYTWFREHYIHNGAVEANKQDLKARYDAAKQAAATVNQARGAINRLKASIEKVRVGRAMETLGGEQGGDSGTSPEEDALLIEMDAEKRAYKTAFQSLRSLKGEIEGIQRVMEKARGRLQDDFLDWLRVVRGRRRTGTLPVDGDAQPLRASSTWDAQDGGATATPTPARSPLRHAQSSYDPHQASMRASVGHAPRTPAAPAGDRGYARPRDAHVTQSAHGHPAPPLTGDSQADEDIMAFYKAKRELQARMAAGK